MRLDDEQASSNVEDRRGQRGRRGGFRIPMGRRGGGGIGIGTIVILGILWLVFGVNPLEMLSGGGLPQQQTQQVPQTQQQQGAPAANDEMGKFASKVLSTTERTCDPNTQGKRTSVRRTAHGAVLRFRAISLWCRPICDGAVLLSARQESLC